MEKIGAIVDKVAVIVLPALADAFSWLADRVSEAMPFIEGLIEGLQPVFKVLGDVVGVVFRGIQSVIGTAVTIIRVQFAIIGVIIDILKSVFGALGTFVKGVMDGIVSAINVAISAMNILIGKQDAASKRDRQNYEDAGIFGINPFGIFGSGSTGGSAGIRTNIPTFHSGGIVPGKPGADVLTMLQAGERVLPRTSVGSGAAELTFNFYGPVYGDGPFLDDLTNRIAQRLRYSTGT